MALVPCFVDMAINLLIIIVEWSLLFRRASASPAVSKSFKITSPRPHQLPQHWIQLRSVDLVTKGSANVNEVFFFLKNVYTISAWTEVLVAECGPHCYPARRHCSILRMVVRIFFLFEKIGYLLMFDHHIFNVSGFPTFCNVLWRVSCLLPQAYHIKLFSPHVSMLCDVFHVCHPKLSTTVIQTLLGAGVH